MTDVAPIFNDDEVVSLGHVTTSAPTYVNGDDKALSLKTNGDLRVSDADVLAAINLLASALGAAVASIFKFNEVANPAKTETDLASTTYTVPAGKKFILQTFAASYDAQAAMIVRLKKQTGGSGSFVTQFKLVMMSGGQGDQTLSYSLGSGINIGSPTDVFKITVESSIAKGNLWAEFSGTEV